MKRQLLPILTLMAGILLGPCALGKTSDEAMKLALRLTQEGAAAFSSGDVEAMASQYAPDAKIFMVTEKEGELAVQEVNGHDEIVTLYSGLVQSFRNSTAGNTVEYAKFVTPRVLVISGTFIPDQHAENPLKLSFYQVRVKKEDKWLIQSLRIFLLSPSE